MSRFFFVRRVEKKRNPWKCDMHWRDNVFTLSPRTPDRVPNLAPFLESMHDKSYNVPELTKEDLLCFFKFSGKGVEFVGDLDERMGKAELLQAMQEVARASGEVAPPKKVTKKRKAPSTAEKEARGEKRKKASASTSGAQKEEGPERGHPLDPSKDSLVESPSAVAATRYICNMAPDRDLKVLREADNVEVIGHFSANISSAVAWGGEMVKRLTRAHRKATASRQRLDEIMGQHAEVLAWLEELEAHRAREEEEARIQREALEAELASEKEARAAEKAAREALEAELGEVKARAVQEGTRKNFDKVMSQHAEAVARLEEVEAHRARELEAAKTQLESLGAELAAEKEARATERNAMVAELEKANAWAGQEAERLKSEAREEFLKSYEFDSLLAKKGWSYFKDGFWGCLAQFRPNGYSEEEHPASFLDLQQALADVDDEEEAEEDEEEEDEEGGGGDADDNPPPS
ncbi:hypothetical protein F511_31825 [Dorcoceras hygrometricum]|uniref:Uncharacterized protein n=1 Tax=Dorcoceras hygrometricum TaxID=472368 RepID=A0A2Z7DG89_9LAMI|nr:hypothetical protein F511_31825 [Dorcoceras hygrometricum]